MQIINEENFVIHQRKKNIYRKYRLEKIRIHKWSRSKYNFMIYRMTLTGQHLFWTEWMSSISHSIYNNIYLLLIHNIKANNFSRDRIGFCVCVFVCIQYMLDVCAVNFVAWMIYINMKWSEIMGLDRGCVDVQRVYYVYRITNKAYIYLGGIIDRYCRHATKAIQEIYMRVQICTNWIVARVCIIHI